MKRRNHYESPEVLNQPLEAQAPLCESVEATTQLENMGVVTIYDEFLD
ncbi:MAG: hypothetical protein J6P75_00030 [Bacteroidales bacterium]|nr:hypothetical protein [Bacteroidales bacterium]MBP5398595.1 hypothetical protein [Bacteroidales bacterium]